MFPPDVDVDPNVPKQHAAALATEVQRQAPKHIKHVNTRLPDDDEEDDGAVAGSSRSSRRASSPSRSRVAAAIHGTPCEFSPEDWGRCMPRFANQADFSPLRLCRPIFRSTPHVWLLCTRSRRPFTVTLIARSSCRFRTHDLGFHFGDSASA